MGKKRRLNAGFHKFGAKHNAHPRARLLLEKETEKEVLPVVEVIPQKEVVMKVEATKQAPAKKTIEVAKEVDAPPATLKAKISPPKMKEKKKSQPLPERKAVAKRKVSGRTIKN